MSEHLTNEMKDELRAEFFLIKRGAFWGSFFGILVAAGLISWGSAKAAISTWAQAPVLEKLESAEAVADRLLTEGVAVPSGAIVLLSNESECPEASERISDFNMAVHTHNATYFERSKASASANSNWPSAETTHWDRWAYKACLFTSN